MATEVITANIGNSTMDGDGRSSVSVVESREEDKPLHSEHAQSNQQKKAHRRKPSKKKRKWKPYSKMSWEERKALEEKEKSKAVRMREEMKEKGRPVAPYNTTQFLMDEHDPYDGDFESSGYNNSNVSTTGTDEGESFSDDQDDMNGSITSQDGEEPMAEYTDSPHMVPEFISQDFSETYERVHEESLNTMTREELLSEHMDLEKRFNQLQEQLAKAKRSHSSKINALEARVEELEGEKANLLAENERLLQQIQISKPGKCESSMSTSDTEETEGSTLEKINNLTQGEVMERR